MKITATDRPFVLACDTDHAPISYYTLSAEEIQRLLDDPSTKIVRATPNRVVMARDWEHDGVAGTTRSVIYPATHGGGPAFIIEREAR